MNVRIVLRSALDVEDAWVSWRLNLKGCFGLGLPVFPEVIRVWAVTGLGRLRDVGLGI